jgi:hypothetical protein
VISVAHAQIAFGKFTIFTRANSAAPANRKCGIVISPKSKTQFNGVGGLLTYISFTQGADDMSDHDEWISYSHWGMFLTGTKYSK